jgi:hypothetical protein
MSANSRVCPFNGCSARIDPHRFACLACWNSLSGHQKVIISDNFHRFLRGLITGEQLRVIQQTVLDTTAVGGNARKNEDGTAAAAPAGPDPLPEPVPCKSCGALIRYVRSAKSEAFMPVDAEPNPAGSIRLNADGRAAVIPKKERQAGGLFDAAGDVYMSHFGTCPNAKEHSRR